MKKNAYCCIEHLLCSYLAVREPTEDIRKDRHQKVMPLAYCKSSQPSGILVEITILA